MYLNNEHNIRTPAKTEEVIATFGNPKESFKSKTLADLQRSVIVLKLCRWPWLVTNSDRLLRQSTKSLGPSFTNTLLKATFFSHFCAGEDENSIKPTVQKLRANGVGAILDFAAEGDIQDSLTTSNDTGEISCDKNMEIFIKCIRTIRELSPEGFAAIKVTALAQPHILERFSAAIKVTNDLFSYFDKDENGLISKHEFQEAFKEIIQDSTFQESENIFESLKNKETGLIDNIEWTHPTRLKELWKWMSRSVHKDIASAVPNQEELSFIDKIFHRMDRIAKCAADLNVHIMVDAEHSYFQDAISHLVLALQLQYNNKTSLIFHTYQCYLKQTYSNVVTDLERAKRFKYTFAAKVVRGAYMVLERNRAKQMDYADPIHESIEDTHATYHLVLDIILNNIDCASVIIATHNQYSIEYALHKMNQLNIMPTDKRIGFAQLLGMADYLTFNLGQHGYKAFKYVPYGPVQEVIPYLIRRAQENSNVLGGVAKELPMIQQELRNRVVRFRLTTE